MTNDELLKQAALDYFRYAQTETDGYSFGVLVGMRSVFTLTGRKQLEAYVNELLNKLKQIQK